MAKHYHAARTACLKKRIQVVTRLVLAELGLQFVVNSQFLFQHIQHGSIRTTDDCCVGRSSVPRVDIHKVGDNDDRGAILISQVVSQPLVVLFIPIHGAALAEADHLLQFLPCLGKNNQGVFPFSKANGLRRRALALNHGNQFFEGNSGNGQFLLNRISVIRKRRCFSSVRSHNCSLLSAHLGKRRRAASFGHRLYSYNCARGS